VYWRIIKFWICGSVVVLSWHLIVYRFSNFHIHQGNISRVLYICVVKWVHAWKSVIVDWMVRSLSFFFTTSDNIRPPKGVSAEQFNQAGMLTVESTRWDEQNGVESRLATVFSINVTLAAAAQERQTNKQKKQVPEQMVRANGAVYSIRTDLWGYQDLPLQGGVWNLFILYHEFRIIEWHDSLMHCPSPCAPHGKLKVMDSWLRTQTITATMGAYP
jgi:hypothetical protein